MQEYARDPLLYEIWMAAGLVARIGRHGALFDAGLSVERDGPLAAELLDFVARNADIESFVLHVRILTQFLYPNKPKPGDVIAADYFERPAAWSDVRPKQLPKQLKRVIARGSEEVAHLSFARLGKAEDA